MHIFFISGVESRFYICISDYRKHYSYPLNVGKKNRGRLAAVSMRMLAPRKFMQRKKVEHKGASDDDKNMKWMSLIKKIDGTGSAVKIFTEMDIHTHTCSKDLIIGTLVRYKQLKNWNLVIEILEWLRLQDWWDFSEMDFLMLMTSYGKRGDFINATKVSDHMIKSGYEPGLISQTALIEAYGKGGSPDMAQDIFKKMQSSGPQPSALTCQIMLKILVERGKYKDAEELFENILKENQPSLRPDGQMFNMMIYMYGKIRKKAKAKHLFNIMVERGVKRSTVTYNSLMSFENTYKEVERIYNEIWDAGLRPDVVSYALLISVYGKSRLQNQALAVFEEMLDCKVRPTLKAYNILLDAFATSGMVKQAETIFRCIRRDRFTLDVFSHSTMLSAYVNASDMDGAELFFKKMKETEGIQPNIVTYGALMKGYVKNNNLEKVMETYERMKGDGLKGSLIIFTMIMDAHGNNTGFSGCVPWFKEMVQSGITPDRRSKGILFYFAKTTEECEKARLLVGS